MVCLRKVFVFKMVSKKVDHVTSRLTPLPPLYQRLHWRRGIRLDEQLLFPPPSPTLKSPPSEF